MMQYNEVVKVMQSNRHLRHNPAGSNVEVAVFQDEESGAARVADGTTDMSTLRQLESDGLISKRTVDGRTTSEFDWYDLTEKGRNYKP
jgi:DNA-binding PadR family transcriptional regulator